MVHKQMQTRDYLRNLVSKINKTSGVSFNSSKLNSKEECEKYILNLIKDLKNNPGNNKAYIKEVNDLKEEIEILNNNLLAKNKEKANLKDKFEKLESERVFYITQAKEAGEKREKAEKEKEYYRNNALYWNDTFHDTDNKLTRAENLNFFFGALVFVEAISIAMLIWK
jgi:chromosome segregation ATPase